MIMKSLKYICSVIVLGTFTTFISCKDDDSGSTPTELELQLTALQNGGSDWVLGNNGVLKDGFDVTDQFAGFKLNIGAFTFTTENSLSGAWPESGTWEFQNGNPNQILRDDGVIMTIALSEEDLTVSFQGMGTAGGRTTSVDGEYVFHLMSE